MAVDRDPRLAATLLGQPWYRGNRVPACVDPDVILDRFTTIFEASIAPVAGRRSLARAVRLDRLPEAAAGLGRRLRRWTRKATLRLHSPHAPAPDAPRTSP